MRNLFFYGTLRHLPLLEIVMDAPTSALDLQRAELPDHAVFSVAEGPFPMICAEQGAQADGVILRNVSQAQIDRLDFYEGSFAYDLHQVTMADGQTAEVYFPQPGQWTAQDPWSLEAWEADWAEMSCHAAREVMGYMGTRDRDAVAAMFPMIRARAASKVRAAQSLHGEGTLEGRIDVTARQRAYAHFFALDDYRLRHERFDGSLSEEMARAVFIATDAAILLPYDPIRDRVLLVEQMRMGPLARGDRACWQLEPIAGHVDPGETPIDAARREAQEEAGLTLGAVEAVAQVYASPGNSTEFYYIFCGLADLPDNVTGLGGLSTEHEDIRSHLLSFDALMTLVEGMGAANAPLVLAAFWLARNRDRLRGTA
ncbi:NUDIX domain-containing protein [Sulfitobacter sp. JB4-11]|uniref:NUDIX domain-containing protein n=1 Tax=Sulfitobacter rhodophyticola TaxID=3238304 RepID=UPI0035137026